jgi:NADPH:quinone reductase
MRGIKIDEFGGPEKPVVHDLPEPVPAAGERVFEVLSTGVDYADTERLGTPGRRCVVSARVCR